MTAAAEKIDRGVGSGREQRAQQRQHWKYWKPGSYPESLLDMVVNLARKRAAEGKARSSERRREAEVCNGNATLSGSPILGFLIRLQAIVWSWALMA